MSQGKSLINLSNILNARDLPFLTNEIRDFCETELREKELLNALTYIPNKKTPRNDGLSKEFYEEFWNELKDPLLKSFFTLKRTKSFLHYKGKP